MLSKLKLGDLTLKVASLSGGQKKRLALCTALLEKPDLLILDEPTNHLDMEMIEWLEAYFMKEKLTLLMVTHDRYFLERVCNEIIELDEGRPVLLQRKLFGTILKKERFVLPHEETVAHKTKRHFVKELEWDATSTQSQNDKIKITY